MRFYGYDLSVQPCFIFWYSAANQTNVSVIVFSAFVAENASMTLFINNLSLNQM